MLQRHGSITEGNWYGNDTIWRTILDLCNIITFADKKGEMRAKPQRRYMGIIDGIIGMEKQGPMHGYPKPSSFIIEGFHPVAVNYIASYIMGFNPQKIPKIREGMREHYFSLTPFSQKDISVRSDFDWEKMNMEFIPAKGWQRHIER